MVTFALFLVALPYFCLRVAASFWIVAGGGHDHAQSHPHSRRDLVKNREGDRGRFICPILTQTLPVPANPPFPRKINAEPISRWRLLGGESQRDRDRPSGSVGGCDEPRPRPVLPSLWPSRPQSGPVQWHSCGPRSQKHTFRFHYRTPQTPGMCRRQYVWSKRGWSWEGWPCAMRSQNVATIDSSNSGSENSATAATASAAP